MWCVQNFKTAFKNVGILKYFKTFKNSVLNSDETSPKGRVPFFRIIKYFKVF